MDQVSRGVQIFDKLFQVYAVEQIRIFLIDRRQQNAVDVILDRDVGSVNPGRGVCRIGRRVLGHDDPQVIVDGLLLGDLSAGEVLDGSICPCEVVRPKNQIDKGVQFRFAHAIQILVPPCLDLLDLRIGSIGDIAGDQVGLGLGIHGCNGFQGDNIAGVVKEREVVRRVNVYVTNIVGVGHGGTVSGVVVGDRHVSLGRIMDLQDHFVRQRVRSQRTHGDGVILRILCAIGKRHANVKATTLGFVHDVGHHDVVVHFVRIITINLERIQSPSKIFGKVVKVQSKQTDQIRNIDRILVA